MIITIGGEYGCGGKPIAEKAAELLGYQFCDDELVLQAVKDSGVDMTEETFRYFDESQGTASLQEITRLSGVQNQNYHGLLHSLSLDVLPLDRRMSMVQEKVVQRFAQQGNCILMGRCADYYLRGRTDTVRVFIIDEMPQRVQRIMDAFGIDEESARRTIRKADRRRADYYAFFTGKRWGDRGNYDLILRCSPLGEEGCAQLLAQLTRLRSGSN